MRLGPLERLAAARRSFVGRAKGFSIMLDVIVLAMGLGFFALAGAYTLACDRL